MACSSCSLLLQFGQLLTCGESGRLICSLSLKVDALRFKTLVLGFGFTVSGRRSKLFVWCLNLRWRNELPCNTFQGFSKTLNIKGVALGLYGNAGTFLRLYKNCILASLIPGDKVKLRLPIFEIDNDFLVKNFAKASKLRHFESSFPPQSHSPIR